MKDSGLRREIGVFGATMMGLGSIVGTGVFVSIGLGTDIAGPNVIFAIFLASLVAICNGLSSAQLAANHPVSGGTYEYGHRWLTPTWGFVAGWMFLCAKSASAGTAALGFSGAIVKTLQLDPQLWLVLIAWMALLLLTAVVLCGISRTNLANIVIVSITMLALICFIALGMPSALASLQSNVFAANGSSVGWSSFLEATALMFVAYTGYGRIATLGEEVHHPRRTIPFAIIVTLVVSMLLYIGVAVTGIGILGAERFGEAARLRFAPLQEVVAELHVPGLPFLIGLGAMTAMLGVLLNLVLGLSRVVLAMGRRHDLPESCAIISKQAGVPWVATLVVAAIIGIFVSIGNIKTTWSFSAFTVLVYYAITNACALRIAKPDRLFPIWPAYVGLAACLFLAFWVEPRVWMAGVVLILVGLVGRFAFHKFAKNRNDVDAN